MLQNKKRRTFSHLVIIYHIHSSEHRGSDIRVGYFMATPEEAKLTPLQKLVRILRVRMTHTCYEILGGEQRVDFPN